MNVLALALAFLLELVALVYFAAVSFTFDIAKPVQFLVSIVLLSVLVTFWGTYMAPRGSKRFAPTAYYIAQTCIYAVSAFAIFQLAGPKWCWVFVGLAVLDDIALFKHNREITRKS